MKGEFLIPFVLFFVLERKGEGILLSSFCLVAENGREKEFLF